MIRADYSPPTTLAEDLNRQYAEIWPSSTHVMVLDRDVQLYDDDWIYLPSHYPDMDIIGFHVVPSSRVFRYWESLTFWLRFNQRIRDCAVIYRRSFLDKHGGFPDIDTPGTWLADRTEKKIVSPVRVLHIQPFNISHSYQIQLRDGRARAQMNKSFWTTFAHSIVRVRPLVLIGYLKEKLA